MGSAGRRERRLGLLDRREGGGEGGRFGGTGRATLVEVALGLPGEETAPPAVLAFSPLLSSALGAWVTGAGRASTIEVGSSGVAAVKG